MRDMKHFAEAVGRSTPGRLDKKTKRPTVKSVRVKMRNFASQRQRETNLTIPKEVHDSVAPVSAPAGLPTPKATTHRGEDAEGDSPVQEVKRSLCQYEVLLRQATVGERCEEVVEEDGFEVFWRE